MARLPQGLVRLPPELGTMAHGRGLRVRPRSLVKRDDRTSATCYEGWLETPARRQWYRCAAMRRETNAWRWRTMMTTNVRVRGPLGLRLLARGPCSLRPTTRDPSGLRGRVRGWWGTRLLRVEAMA